jgi:hypothetical protein
MTAWSEAQIPAAATAIYACWNGRLLNGLAARAEYELLNAARRAGCAGHLANETALLIPQLNDRFGSMPELATAA